MSNEKELDRNADDYRETLLRGWGYGDAVIEYQLFLENNLFGPSEFRHDYSNLCNADQGVLDKMIESSPSDGVIAIVSSLDYFTFQIIRATDIDLMEKIVNETESGLIIIYANHPLFPKLLKLGEATRE